MLFRNLVLFRLPSPWNLSAPQLEEALRQRPLRPCGAFDLQTRGWIECGETQQLLYVQGTQLLLTLGVEQKLLPASVIMQEARVRAAQLAETQGHPVGRRQMRELKARVADELRAKAFSRRRATEMWINPGQGWLAVNASNANRAEEAVEVLRNSLGGLAVTPLETQQALVGPMTTWLSQARAPGRFAIEQDLELKAADGSGATVRYSHHPLDGRDVRDHLTGGKTPTRLGLTWADRVSFVLHQNLQIRRLQFLEVVRDGQAQAENAQEQFDIDFALMSGELTQLIGELLSVLGGMALPQMRAAA